MRKKMFVLLVSLIMLVSINSVVYSNEEPTKAFMGAATRIASIDLNTWDVNFFDIEDLIAPADRNLAVVESVKYFPEEEKLSFAVSAFTGDYSYNVGVIDVKTGEVTEFEGVRSYSLRTRKDNKIYLTLEDREIISYDLSKDKIEVEFKADSREEGIQFYEEEVSPETPDYDQSEFLEELTEQDIMPEDTDRNDLLFRDAGINNQLYEDYFIARKGSKFIVIEILDDEELKFEVVNESPAEFRQENNLRGDGSVDFKFD